MPRVAAPAPVSDRAEGQGAGPQLSWAVGIWSGLRGALAAAPTPTGWRGTTEPQVAGLSPCASGSAATSATSASQSAGLPCWPPGRSTG